MQTSLKLKYILVLLILIPIILVSCKKDEPRPIINPDGPECVEDTINLGYIDFTAKTDQWKNYTIEDKIFFVNAENEEVFFIKELDISTSFHSFHNLSIECKYGDLNEYSFLGERWDQLFICEEKELRLRYRINIYAEVSSNSFVDRLLALIETANVNDTFNIIRQDIDYHPILEGSNSAYTLIEDFSEFHENIELLGKTFSNVYEKSYPNRSHLDRLYINENFGIVGFTDRSNKLWVFDRIE